VPAAEEWPRGAGGVELRQARGATLTRGNMASMATYFSVGCIACRAREEKTTGEEATMAVLTLILLEDPVSPEVAAEWLRGDLCPAHRKALDGTIGDIRGCVRGNMT
jgi:hypothetical protein